MKVSPIRNEFARMTDHLYSDTFCAVCGWGIRQDEETARDENNKLCHAECVEEEKQNG